MWTDRCAILFEATVVDVSGDIVPFVSTIVSIPRVLWPVS